MVKKVYREGLEFNRETELIPTFENYWTVLLNSIKKKWKYWTDPTEVYREVPEMSINCSIF